VVRRERGDHRGAGQFRSGGWNRQQGRKDGGKAELRKNLELRI
jgi:hypothetical protein